MKASARVETAHRNGRDVLVDLRSEPPLAVRRTPGRVLLVGSAASPVGGDRTELELVVGDGSRLILGTAAATIVWPGRDRSASLQQITGSVGDGGHLEFRPEPTVVVRGAQHRSTIEVCLSEGASLLLVDEISLGRTGECSGSIELAISVLRNGRPLLRHEEHLGPDALGYGSLVSVGRARHLISIVTVGLNPGDSCVVLEPPGERPASIATDRDGGQSGVACAGAAWLPIADDAAVAFGLAEDRISAWAHMEQVLPAELSHLAQG